MSGIIVEFAGVLLLAWEWFAAQRQEASERAIEASHARQDESMARMQQLQPANPHMQRHFEMSRDVHKRMSDGRVADTRRRYSGMRSRAVAFALLFIVVGFALQLLGAWPGCCRAIGILPGG